MKTEIGGNGEGHDESKEKRPNICSIFQYQTRESQTGGGGGDNRVCVICECVFRTDGS